MDLVQLAPLCERNSGGGVTIGLIDGPVARDHPDLVDQPIHESEGAGGSGCSLTSSIACMHGTFVAGILGAKRGSLAPAICPDSTLVIRPIFSEMVSQGDPLPSATAKELAAAISDCIDARSHCINLSLALAQPSTKGELELEQVLDQAAKSGVIIVAAAGNQGTLGSTAITRHPWVIPVVACDIRGMPTAESNLGHSIGKRGLRAPGEAITSLAAGGQTLTLGGTSVAAPFVTGAAALLCAEFPHAAAAHIKYALTLAFSSRRASVVPPLMNAWASYQFLASTQTRSGSSRIH